MSLWEKQEQKNTMFLLSGVYENFSAALERLPSLTADSIALIFTVSMSFTSVVNFFHNIIINLRFPKVNISDKIF